MEAFPDRLTRNPDYLRLFAAQVTSSAAGFLARAVGTPLTFTFAGVVCGLLVLVALLPGGQHRHAAGLESQGRAT